jgi:regulator of nucleoside diphosphate kinase
MATARGAERPPVHLTESESDLVARLAMQAEHRSPIITKMLLEEIDRAELYQEKALPNDAISLGSNVEYVDERSGRIHKVQLVLPAQANISDGRVSIITPIGAALYGLRAGSVIDWPDVAGNSRRLRILKVLQPKRAGSTT